MVLLARPGLGVTTADQLVALARQKPNGLSVGTTGNASLQAFAAVACSARRASTCWACPTRAAHR
jgi:tripartite-type tricarboxylate transporter receptor subunit TctC